MKKKSASIWIVVVIVGAIILSITMFFIKITVIDYNTFKNKTIKNFNDNKEYFEIIRESLLNEDVKSSYKDAEYITYFLDSLYSNNSKDKIEIKYLVEKLDCESHKGTILLTSNEIFAFEEIGKLYHYGVDDIHLANNGQMYFGRKRE